MNKSILLCVLHWSISNLSAYGIFRPHVLMVPLGLVVLKPTIYKIVWYDSTRQGWKTHMKTHTGTGSSEILFSGGSTFRHPVATKSCPVNEFSRVTFSTKLYQRKFDNNNCLFFLYIYFSYFHFVFQGYMWFSREIQRVNFHWWMSWYWCHWTNGKVCVL